MENSGICGVRLPDSRIAREITQLVRDTESDLLYQHSVRVYYWGALAGRRQGLRFDPELLYGTTPHYHGSRLRFEVDGANAARDFLRGHGMAEDGIEKVW